MVDKIEGAIIEIVERTDNPDPAFIVPNEIWVNGSRLYTSKDDPVEVERISVVDRDLVKVTMSVIAKRVTIALVARDDHDA